MSGGLVLEVLGVSQRASRMSEVDGPARERNGRFGTDSLFLPASHVVGVSQSLHRKFRKSAILDGRDVDAAAKRRRRHRDRDAAEDGGSTGMALIPGETRGARGAPCSCRWRSGGCAGVVAVGVEMAGAVKVGTSPTEFS
jgi:hypothetical protein